MQVKGGGDTEICRRILLGRATACFIQIMAGGRLCYHSKAGAMRPKRMRKAAKRNHGAIRLTRRSWEVFSALDTMALLRVRWKRLHCSSKLCARENNLI